MAVIQQPSMNGDMSNFSMGPKDEDSFSTGNLQEEVFIVYFHFCAMVRFVCAHDTSAGERIKYFVRIISAIFTIFFSV